MSNALAVPTGYSAELAALIGQGGGGGATQNLPRLKTNTDHVVEIDGQDYPVPAGGFVVKGPDGANVYAKGGEFTFRPLAQRYYWAKFDEAANEGKGGYTGHSIFIAKHSEEPYDDQGGVALGKIRGKAAKPENMSKAQLAIQKQVQSFRLVFGTVTGTFKTAQGKVVELTDYPVELRLRGTNYMPFGDEVEKKVMQSKRMLPNVELKLSTTRHKKGSTTYYIIGYEYDPTNVRPIDQDTMDTLQQFAEHFKTRNEMIMEKHHAARNGGDSGGLSAEDGLDDDWNSGSGIDE